MCWWQVLKAPEKLPSAEQAAYKSMPEAQMLGRRYALAEVQDHPNNEKEASPVKRKQCMR